MLVFLSGAFAGGGARWVRKWEAKALQTFLRLSLREEPKCPVTMQRIFGGSKRHGTLVIRRGTAELNWENV